MDPKPLFLMDLFASNIGGKAMLIGDPPNMIVSSVAGFSFNDVILAVAPTATFVLFASTFYLYRYYKATLVSDAEALKRLQEVDEYKLIVNKPLMIKLVIIICLALIGVLHGVFHVLPSVVALSAAGVMLAISYTYEKPIIHNDVEWPALIYFVCLFVMAGTLQETGAINAITDSLMHLFNGKAVLTILGVL